MIYMIVANVKRIDHEKYSNRRGSHERAFDSPIQQFDKKRGVI